MKTPTRQSGESAVNQDLVGLPMVARWPVVASKIRVLDAQKVPENHSHAIQFKRRFWDQPDCASTRTIFTTQVVVVMLRIVVTNVSATLEKPGSFEAVTRIFGVVAKAFGKVIVKDF